MGIQLSKAHDLMTKALDYRATRQDLIAGNIANEDTPFYRPRDISFAGSLQAEAKKIFNEPQVATLELARTNGAHFKSAQKEGTGQAQLFYRDGHLARNDGNSVDLDVETTEMAKNTMMFQAITASLKKEAAIFKAVLQASERTQ
ncbi:MAG: flagellar basal body rod protein FlgB [Arcobacter sp.]|nr:MAG: flagellar basal body rod protein FlgB [Arcobacter sp.]